MVSTLIVSSRRFARFLTNKMEKLVRHLSALTSTLLCLAVACGGSTPKTDTTPDQGDTPPAIQPQDIAHEYAAVELEGTRFEPQALGMPNMPPVTSKRMPSLKKARATYAKQAKKGKFNQTDVHVLVTLVFTAAETKMASGDPAQLEEAKALIAEGAAALEALRTSQGDKATELVTRRLAVAKAWQGDHAGASELFAAAAAYDTTDNDEEYNTWVAYYKLEAGDVAGAAALVDGWDVNAVSGQAAYVIAWVKLRQWDGAGAGEAIVAAAKNWKGGGKKELLHDVKVVAARSGLPVEQGIEAIKSILPEGKPLLVTLHTYEFHQALLFAGRYADASAALDTIFEGATQSDQVTFRFNQADYAFRQGKPAAAAEKVKQAHDLCAAWDQCPDAIKNAIAERMLLLARVYHNTYATSLDDNYANAAKVLYGMYLAITPERADKAEVDGNAKTLEQHMASADKAAGKHAKDTMKNVLTAHGEALNACYELGLSASPELTGTVKITIDVDPSGAVTGVVTEPAAGKEGLAAVASCAATDIKTWAFPSRTVPGLTRLVYPVTFKPKAAEAAPAAAAATP